MIFLNHLTQITILERLKGRSVEIELRSLLKGTANDILFN